LQVFEVSQVTPFSLERVSAFFTDPANLRLLTPRWLRLSLVEAPAEIGVGSRLRYRVAPFGVPLAMVAEISDWAPPFRFADKQMRGPYRHWEHTHSFSAVPDGTEISDHIVYRLPGGPLAPVADRLGHRALLSRLFDYRTRRLTELLAQPSSRGA
jgi:ligand-binding SRPBCC domain-containing protein